MANILEAAMLVCFGLSWPINVMKNIKSRTAKNMSLRFTFLIIMGYVAGILAKLSMHKVNYVLAVYIINLVIVSVNVVVYFVNKRDNGCSELYSLYDFKDFRDNYDMEKAYLQGRFDAIPYLSIPNI